MGKIFLALLFTLLSSFSCITCDVLSKFFTGSIEDLLCLRFFLSTLILLIYYRSLSFISIKNIARGFLFAASMFFFTYGLKNLPLTLVILINFATPIFTIILSKLFLQEKIKYRLLSCLINTIGIFIAVYPLLEYQNIYPVISILAASFMFSLMEILNKSSVKYERIDSILIGSSFFSLLFTIPKYSFTMPSNNNIWILVGTAVASFLIPYFTYLSNKRMNLSAAQPLKYIEFPMTIIANNLFFHEQMYQEIYYGFAIIFIGVIVNYIYEIRNLNN